VRRPSDGGEEAGEDAGCVVVARELAGIARPAGRASAVRFQARNVRSFANENRTSMPRPGTLAAKRKLSGVCRAHERAIVGLGAV
jgi:hypothetical protein